MTLPSASHILFSGALLALGGVVGYGLSFLGTPLPYMLGALLAAALAVAFGQSYFPEGYAFPMSMRELFVGVIGTMIGAQVNPDFLSLLPLLALTGPAVLIFVALAHALNFQVFRRLGGYDAPTAYYAGAPGGLIESIAFGEEHGADLRILTLMQFLRIIVVVTVVPFGISLWEGHAVGSAAGVMGPSGDWSWYDLPLIFAIGLLGQWIGRRLKLPASILTGPLLVMGILAASGLVSVVLPPWLVALAQVVLGTGLGLRFIGMTRAMFVKGIGLSCVSVAMMLALGIALSAILHAIGGLPVDMLLISFAPGGVTEMSLIALSLAANPAFVTLHHVLRISLTVIGMSLGQRLNIVRLS
ncbi:MAG: AbrB family transcriptional regulator [Maritimibacter sp.]